MPYLDRDAFLKDFHDAQDLAIAKHGAFVKKVDDDIAWKTYTNSAKKTNSDDNVLGLMLFGRHLASMKAEVAKRANNANSERIKDIMEKDKKMKEKWYVPSFIREKITNSRTTASFKLTEKEKTQIPASIEEDEHSTQRKNFGIVNNSDSGSILLMGSDKWNLTINDTWVLGAVHSNLPFYPASNVSRSNIFDTKFILSITGRELFGLALFGYRQVFGHKSIGSAFEVADHKKATAATLVAYQNKMSALTQQEADNVFRDAGFRISEIGI